MRNIRQTALVPFSAESVFEVVNDIDSYPCFLPWCSGSMVLSRSSTEIVARLDISAAGIKQSFTTINRVVPFERIELSLLRGPFSKLDGCWKFTTISNLGCKVELALSFDLGTSFLETPLSRMFDKSAEKLVDAFCARVEQKNS